MDALERDIFGGIENAMTVIADEMQRLRIILERFEPALRKQEAKQEPEDPSILTLPFTALGISTRAETALISNRCVTIGDVAALSLHKLQTTWHCGEKTIKEIETALAKNGLKLAS